MMWSLWMCILLVFLGDEVDCVPISYILLCSAVIEWNSTAVIGASFRSVSFCSLLLYGSLTVVFFFYHRHPGHQDFNSIVSSDAVRVESYMNCFLCKLRDSGADISSISPLFLTYFLLQKKKQFLHFSMICGMLLTLIRSGNVSCTNHFTALEYLAQITAIGYCFLVMMSQNLGAMHAE